MKDWDLNVVIGENVYNDDGHFAGSDSERILDFQTALDDNSISAIWCARGGYGAMRVIDNLNFEKYKENPKWIIGYSDITAIHNDLHIQKSESIHGLMCKSLEKLDINKDESVKLLKKTLFGNSLSYQIEETVITLKEKQRSTSWWQFNSSTLSVWFKIFNRY